MNKIIKLFDATIHGLNFFSPVADLLLRLYVASVFWKSGAVKIMDMEMTIKLFTHEYQVPILSCEIAAYLCTGIELLFSALLVLGLVTRGSALILFILNFMAVISYPALLDVALKWHLVWGLILLIIVCHGPGKLSLDHLIWRKLSR
jgi:putative oxidoreductase